MGDGAKGYNGWANYETCCVHLWLTNEEGSYRYWREEAERHRKENGEDASGTLAEQLKSELEEASPVEEASLFSDLLSTALGEVDWFEVADAFLEEVEPDDEPEEDDQAEEDDEEAFTAEEFARLKRERSENGAKPLFELGQTVSTPGALSALTRREIAQALTRHHQGDWGDVGRFDWGRNEEALTGGERLVSVYHGRTAQSSTSSPRPTALQRACCCRRSIEPATRERPRFGISGVPGFAGRVLSGSASLRSLRDGLRPPSAP